MGNEASIPSGVAPQATNSVNQAKNNENGLSEVDPLLRQDVTKNDAMQVAPSLCRQAKYRTGILVAKKKKKDVQIPFRRRGKRKPSFAQRSLVFMDQKSMSLRNPKHMMGTASFGARLSASDMAPNPELALQIQQSPYVQAKLSSSRKGNILTGICNQMQPPVPNYMNPSEELLHGTLPSTFPSSSKPAEYPRRPSEQVDNTNAGDKGGRSNAQKTLPTSATAALKAKNTSAAVAKGPGSGQRTGSSSKKPASGNAAAPSAKMVAKKKSVASAAAAPEKPKHLPMTAGGDGSEKLFWLPEWSKPRAPDQEGPEIKRPHAHDVLLGRGRSISQHPGNQIFRALCWSLRNRYNKAHPLDKTDVAYLVLHEVAKLDPPGRFLEYHGNGKTLRVVPLAKATEKARQALRDKKWESLSPVPLAFVAQAMKCTTRKKTTATTKKPSTKKVRK